MTISSSTPPADTKRVKGTSSARPAELRQKILRPYFPLLQDWLEHDLDSTEIPQAAEMEGRRVELGAWERKQFKSYRASPALGLKPDMQLVIEGVAFQFCAQKLQQCFESGPMPQPADLPRFLDGLVDQLAAGMALQVLLQESIDAQIQQGRMPEAKQISEFRTLIVQQVGGLKDRVGNLEVQRAEKTSQPLIHAPAEGLPDPGPTREPKKVELFQEQADELPKWASFAEEEVPEETGLPPWLHDAVAQPEQAARPAPTSTARVKPMLIVLAVLLGVYALVMWPRLDNNLPPELTERDFARFEAVRILRARPPSIFIVVDGTLWDQATPEAKLEMVEGMGAVAGQAGYSGIHIRADQGRVVAEWLKSTGARIRTLAGGAS